MLTGAPTALQWPAPFDNTLPITSFWLIVDRDDVAGADCNSCQPGDCAPGDANGPYGKCQYIAVAPPNITETLMPPQYLAADLIPGTQHNFSV